MWFTGPQVRRTWGITGPKAGPRCVYHTESGYPWYITRGAGEGRLVHSVTAERSGSVMCRGGIR